MGAEKPYCNCPSQQLQQGISRICKTFPGPMGYNQRAPKTNLRIAKRCSWSTKFWTPLPTFFTRCFTNGLCRPAKGNRYLTSYIYVIPLGYPTRNNTGILFILNLERTKVMMQWGCTSWMANPLAIFLDSVAHCTAQRLKLQHWPE